MGSTSRLRVLYVLHQYPQLSETYVKVESEHVARSHDVAVVASEVGPDPFDDALPYRILSRDLGPLREVVEEFRPDVLHAHWLKASPALTVARLAHDTGVPFTIRSHSFDVLWGGARGGLFDRGFTMRGRLLPDWLQAVVPQLNDDLCLGVLGFPFVRPRLERAGLQPSKFHETYPVVDVELFADRTPNGDGVMACGVTSPKKAVGGFAALAKLVPQRSFRFYALGDLKELLYEANDAEGRPVEIVPPIQHRDMLREYKRHEWLVYTGRAAQRSVGWPVAVAEAQAAGVGVCMPRLRPDVAEFVGDAGYLYDTLDEAARIVAAPFPVEQRERGFELAWRSDIRRHISVLTDLWQTVTTRTLTPPLS